jgi:hypothetical protein
VKTARTGNEAGKPSEREAVPLEWVRKWVEDPLQRALQAADAVPLCSLRPPSHLAAWRALRAEIHCAQTACVELRRLAAWLDSFPRPVARITRLAPCAKATAQAKSQHSRGDRRRAI